MSQLAIEDWRQHERHAVLSQWHTRPDLARRIVRWCGKIGPTNNIRRVLEPSAGSGAFVAPLLDHGVEVTAHEIDASWAQHLRDTTGAQVIEGDFLASERPADPYDLAVMNPPYEGGADGDHLAEAMERSLRVVALLRANALFGGARYRGVWRRLGSPSKPGEWWMSGLAVLVSRPGFDGPGATGPMHEFCVVKLTRVDTSCRDPWAVGHRFEPEWWTT